MEISKENLPRHIAVIMDGNGRWAKAKGQPRSMGHRAGVEALKKILEESANLGIDYLTAYAFSTENWKRDAEEVSAIMKLIEIYLKNEINKMMANDIRFKTIGDLSKLPKGVQKILYDSIEKTRDNKGTTLTMALNYGGRDDLTRAMKSIGQRIESGQLKADDIDQILISKSLDTSFLPDPDLVIRPSGELRLSNFLLWEAAYSEFWYSNIYWPDFKPSDLREAIASYQNRDRRFGNAK